MPRIKTLTKKELDALNLQRNETAQQILGHVAGKPLHTTLAALMEVYCFLVVEYCESQEQVSSAVASGKCYLDSLPPNFAGRQMLAMTEKAQRGLSA
jgi:hypothetical protein